MAKAAKRRGKKKSAKKKSAGKRRKSSRKGKSAPKKPSRKSVRRKPARKAPAKEAPAKEAPPQASDPAWPVLFITLFALVAGLAAAWVFGEFSTVANAATLVSTVEAVHGCTMQSVQAAETWLALAYPELVASIR